MFGPLVDAFKVEATNAILARLGNDVYQTLKQDLQTRYKIELAKVTSNDLARLHGALVDLLGAQSARLLMKAIDAEIELLATKEKR